MLHEAPLPKERNTGSEEHAQPLSLVALPSTQSLRTAQSSEKNSSSLKRLGIWMPKVHCSGRRLHPFPERPVDTLVVPFDWVGEIVVKFVGRVVR